MGWADSIAVERCCRKLLLSGRHVGACGLELWPNSTIPHCALGRACGARGLEQAERKLALWFEAIGIENGIYYGKLRYADRQGRVSAAFPGSFTLILFYG